MSDNQLDIDAQLAFPDFDLSISASWRLSGVTAIVGPSGGGKSTLLRLLAGLTRPDKGRIKWRKQLWCETNTNHFTPPDERRIGMVFQDGRLFPHLTVGQNLLYAERRAEKGTTPYRFGDVVAALDLSLLLAKHATALSGGERQRVAIGRMLLSRPELILMDEPMSALDGRRKAAILPYLEALPQQFSVPILYVSHQTDEIARLAENTIIFKAGRIEAQGPTDAMLRAYHTELPHSAPGAVLCGHIERCDQRLHLTYIRLKSGVIALPAIVQKPVGTSMAIRIDAKHVAIAKTPPSGLSIRNILPATIIDIVRAPTSPFVALTLDVSGDTLRSQITQAALEELTLSPGQSVFALIKSASFDLSE